MMTGICSVVDSLAMLRSRSPCLTGPPGDPVPVDQEAVLDDGVELVSAAHQAIDQNVSTGLMTLPSALAASASFT